MGMRGRLTRLFTGQLDPPVYGSAGDMFLHITLDHPKSKEGQKVSVYLSVEDVTELLKVLRRSAIEARR